MPKKKASVGKKLRKFSFEARIKAAEKFKEKILKKFGDAIKSIIIWGSVTRGDYTGKSDVDIYVIFDDTKYSLKVFEEIKDKINRDMAKIAKETDPRISVQPIIPLSEFIDQFREHHPLFYNIVREGYAIYDTGFFIPMRKLLEFGHFPLTKEAAVRRIFSVDENLDRAKNILSLVIAKDIYHAVLDSTQGLLMYLGVEPPAPKITPKVAKKHLLEKGLITEKEFKMLEDTIKFYKSAEYGETKKVTGKEFDEWLKRAEEYVAKIKEVFAMLDAKNKEEEVNKAYEVFIKEVVEYLDFIDKLPEEPKDLPKVFEEELIKKEIIPEYYREVFKKLIQMKKLVEERKFEDIDDRELNLTKEYVRRLMLILRDLRKKKHKKVTTKKLEHESEQKENEENG